VAFQSFVVLVFIWSGDGSRLNKSCLHDLGVPYHHCYRVSSPLLVEFISFWYQSFGSKISFVYLLFFIQFSVLCCVKKKTKKKTRKKQKKQKTEKKVQNSNKKKKKKIFLSILFQQENSSCSSKKNSSFQS
jgi:biopolymer transport protein ExbB/TolQ